MKMPPVICLMGPTASGKSKLALALAEKRPVSIISVDSAQVYRDMDIGTAKPSLREQNSCPHYLINIRRPDNFYTAAEFVADCENIIPKILDSGRIPLLVGGSMMYFRALQQGLSPLPGRDELIRQQFEQQASQLGWPAMHKKLAEIDADSVQHIAPTDAQRISRYLEIYALTGKPASQLFKHKSKPKFNFVNLGLVVEDRKVHRGQIAQRFEQMLASGWVDEVIMLKQKYALDSSVASQRSVGYAQIWQYLENKLNYGQMRERGIIATCQLAKRQMTWLRSWSDMQKLSSIERFDVLLKSVSVAINEYY